MAKKWTPKVKVVRKARRPFYLLRWKSRDGVWRQEATDVPVGETPREDKVQRGRAAKLAAKKEDELAAAPLAEDMLGPLVDAYEASKLGEGLDRKHVQGAADRIRRALKEVPMATLGDIEGAAVSTWFKKLRATRSNWRSKKADPKRETTSYRTINSYLESLKAFCNWLVAERKLAANPLSHLRRRNQEEDRRRIRRALGADEFVRLIAAAEAGPIMDRVTGVDRAMIYVIAAWTGYRAGELAGVTPSDLDLDGEPPTIRVRPVHSKRGRDDRIPIHPALVERIRNWLAGRRTVAISRPLLPLLTPAGNVRRTAEWMAADLKRAGLAVADESGAVADFHACRHTFITNLARSGASLIEAQRAARHSDPRLTAMTYAHLGLLDDAKTVGRLPAPPIAVRPVDEVPASIPFRATGSE
ncbi:MAG TPA: site-specific integrase [Pirellulales bacterium]